MKTTFINFHKNGVKKNINRSQFCCQILYDDLSELIDSHKIYIHVVCKSNLLNCKGKAPRDKNGMKCTTNLM